MSNKPPTADLVAAREHAIASRRTRAHVIICHNLDGKSRSLLDIFGLAGTVDPALRAMVARELAEDILRDVALLKAELDGVESFARRQLAGLPARLRE
jgi:hypothetical protein